MAPTEAELLNFLLRYGSKVLNFPYGSQFYEESGISVADFIVNALEEDGYVMANSRYESICSAFKTMYYDQGLDCEMIVRKLLDGEDRVIASIVADLVIDRYEITSEKMKSALTAESSWLANYVPQSLLNLAEKRLESRVAELKKEILTVQDRERQVEILKEITQNQNSIKKIKEKKIN